MNDRQFFNDEGKPVDVTWPDESMSPEVALLTALEEIGVVIPDFEQAEEIICSSFDTVGARRGAEFVAAILGKLGNSAAELALRRVCLGEDESLRDAAKNAGCSHVAVLKQEQKIRAKLKQGVTTADTW